jgi:hypothetical protein
MAVFLLTMFTAVVLLAAGFLLALFWLRDERARLTASGVHQGGVRRARGRAGHDVKAATA